MKVFEGVIDRPLPVFLAAALVVAGGLWSLSELPVKRAPQVEIPFSLVVVAYPGATPEDVESEIVIELEEQLSSLDDLRHLETASREGFGTVVLEFEDRADMTESTRDVRDRADLAEVEFPDDAESAAVIELSFDDQPIALFTITGGLDLYRLHDLAEDLEPELESVPGVRSVEIFGGYRREVQILADPLRLARHDLTLAELAAAVRAQSRALPVGQLRGKGADRRLRSTGEFSGVEEIRAITVASEPSGPLALQDVAEVRVSHERLTSAAWLDGEPSVTLIVKRRPDVNTLETVEQLKERVDSLRERLPPGVEIAVTEDASRDIARMVRQLGTTAAFGMTLVVAVLFSFFGPRQALLVASVLPFALLFTFIGLRVFDMEISNIAMFALILVLGLVVDGAIIMGEAIWAEREHGTRPPGAAKAALSRVGAPVIAADLTTIAAFVPMLLMVGVMGQFMSVLPKVVVFALLGSIFVDHMLMPAASARIPTSARGDRSTGLPGVAPAMARAREGYTRLLDVALAHRALLLGATAVALAGAAALFLGGAIDSIFLPRTDRAQVTVNYALPLGTPLDETGRVGSLLSEQVVGLPEVERVVLTTGDTGALAIDSREGSRYGPEYGRLSVQLVPAGERVRSQSEIIETLRERFNRFAGVEIVVEEREEGPPTGAALAVSLQGDDLGALAATAGELERRLRASEGARDVRVDYERSKPELQIDVDRARAESLFGIAPDRVAQTLLAAFDGIEVGRMWFAGERVDIRLQAPAEYSHGLEPVRELPLRAAGGELVPLGALAEVSMGFGHTAIYRRDTLRTVTVRAEAGAGSSSVHLERDARAILAEVGLPAGVSAVFGGETEERDRSYASLWRALKWAVLLIYCIIAIQFNSLRQPFVVLLTAPAALVGVAVGLLVTGIPFSFMVFIGIVSLTGIFVNDGIVLIDATNRHRRGGMPVEEAVRRAAAQRFRPVVLTTVTTIAGLLPLTLNLAEGGEFWVPLGVAIITGLLAASTLTLFLVPALYTVLEGPGLHRRARRAREPAVALAMTQPPEAAPVAPPRDGALPTRRGARP